MSRVLRLALLLPFLVAPFAGAGEEAEKPAEKPKETELRKAASAGPSRFVHRIHLKDANGAPIEPQSTAPYSPKQTCSSSTCHNYDTITGNGTHTRMFPAAKYDPQAPQSHKWTVFDAGTGVTAPLSHGFLAAEGETFDSKVHENVFDIARDFGAWHPGGGRFELDSAGKRYDAPKAEAPDADAPETADYAKAKWDESGVLETDCLACHLETTYDHVERADQISRRNYRDAPTVGAGFGVVEGMGSSRQVHYAKDIFNAEGKVQIDIGRPTDANCLYCHRRPARGETTWADCIEADVHSQSDLACIDCHSAGTQHVLFGDPNAKPKEEWATLTCQGCHESGRLGSPLPLHKGLPSLHLEKIACQVCHSGPRPRVTPLAFEVPTDPLWGLPLGSDKPAGPTVFAPIYTRDAQGKLQVVSRMLPTWFGNKLEDGTIVPLAPTKLKSRLRKAVSKKLITDNDGDGEAEINTEAEIAEALKALVRKGVVPVYYAGGRRYELEGEEDDAKLVSAEDPLADPLDRPLAHNVRPAWQAIGAAGCVECHDEDGPFFYSLGVTRALNAEGKPEGVALAARMGRSDLDQTLAEFREEFLRPYAPWVIVLTVLAMLLHLVLFGAHRCDMSGEMLKRFNPLERLMHFALMGSFLLLAFTGLLIASGTEEALGLCLPTVHWYTGLVLIGAAVLAVLLWAKSAIFTKIDIGWVKVMGGYLGYHGRVPAGRFNAGQKAFYWKILAIVACLAVTGYAIKTGVFGSSALLYTLHELCSYAMILLILVHAYLGSLANPGTLRAIFEGKVPRSWAEMHHPDWEAKPVEKE